MGIRGHRKPQSAINHFRRYHRPEKNQDTFTRIAIADRGLYLAKQRGRSRAQVMPDTVDVSGARRFNRTGLKNFLIVP
jgi:hypothetical protein